ncbi:MAG: S8 family peptidase [Bacteroidales bacterium]|nr:S8 family peptidase [Bacteroidales bacterium]MBN2818802.1 S8 family peptidase [Bacteroidales bacterium]
MKRNPLFLLAIAGLFAITSCQKDDEITIVKDDLVSSQKITTPIDGTAIPGQYIVLLTETSVKFKNTDAVSYAQKLDEVKKIAEDILVKQEVSDYMIKNTYAEAVSGFAVKMSDADVVKLAKDKRVRLVEPDLVMMRPPWENPDDGGDTQAQEVPYGIERVGYGDGTGKVAWIIDSGIDLDHPDLNVDQNRSRDFTGSRKGADDENGHGTHVAGTVAAIDNEIGVIGVASGASVVAVKVLDRRGSGSTSGVIAGIDYVASAASAGDAANMSLGGGVSTALDEAVVAASNHGIYFALAAGNESDDANFHSPARANGAYIWTISAMDASDNFAYFSNYGNPPVDFCMPGVNIKSTHYKGGYTTMSGTSMASPHMCGVLLLTNGNPKTSGNVNNDPDGDTDPIGHI